MGKIFESCLYNPYGTVRELKPITNGDLQNLSIPLMNATTSKAITRGNVEVRAEELMVAHAREDFILTETLYQVLIPTVNNMYTDITCEMSIEGNGWERIRNAALNRIMQFDSTVKLWNATKRKHPLFQQLPHTIFYGTTEHYFRLRRLNIPTDLKMAREEFRNLMRTGQTKAIKPEAANILSNWNFDLKFRRRLFKALLIASHVVPRAAVNSRIFNATVVHSLRTELLHDLESNAYSMGRVTNSEDFRFCEVIRKFQEPTEKFLPLSFTTTYKSSMYAVNSKYLTPARMLDSEPIQGIVKRDAAVELNFIVQCLITPWTRRFDRLHDFDHQIPIRDVLPENLDMSKVSVKRSDSSWAKILRGETSFPKEGIEKGEVWTGVRGFSEEYINEKVGLKERKNGTTE